MTPSKPLIATLKKAFSIWEHTDGCAKIYVKETPFQSERYATKAKAQAARHKLAYALAKIIESSK